MRRIKIIKPILFKVLAIFGLILEPFIFSISKKSNLPPSSAGNGIRLIIAKFTEIKAAKESR